MRIRRRRVRKRKNDNQDEERRKGDEETNLCSFLCNHPTSQYSSLNLYMPSTQKGRKDICYLTSRVQENNFLQVTRTSWFPLAYSPLR